MNKSNNNNNNNNKRGNVSKGGSSKSKKKKRKGNIEPAFFSFSEIENGIGEYKTLSSYEISNMLSSKNITLLERYRITDWESATKIPVLKTESTTLAQILELIDSNGRKSLEYATSASKYGLNEHIRCIHWAMGCRREAFFTSSGCPEGFVKLKKVPEPHAKCIYTNSEIEKFNNKSKTAGRIIRHLPELVNNLRNEVSSRSHKQLIELIELVYKKSSNIYYRFFYTSLYIDNFYIVNLSIRMRWKKCRFLFVKLEHLSLMKELASQ